MKEYIKYHQNNVKINENSLPSISREQFEVSWVRQLVYTYESSRTTVADVALLMSYEAANGATENARVENAGVSKMQGWKSRE